MEFCCKSKGENQQTIFKLTKTGIGAFTCENQNNEFPKVIKYFKDGSKLKAEIEGGEMKVDFEFEKSQIVQTSCRRTKYVTIWQTCIEVARTCFRDPIAQDRKVFIRDV